MRYWLAVLLLCLTSPVWAMEHYINTLQDRSGNAIGGVTVTVYEAGTLTPAAIYSDNGVTIKAICERAKGKRHQRPRRATEKGQIISIAAPVSVSNVMLVCPSCSRPMRPRWSPEGDAKKVRLCRKCGARVL